MSDIFYKMRLDYDESGLTVVTEEWVPIHETKCIYFCVPKHMTNYFYNKSTKENLALAKTHKNLKRVMKARSRFAFKTRKEAFDNLCMLKRKQLEHLNRTTYFVTKFLEVADFDKLEDSIWNTIPNTRSLVNKFVNFE